jgi:hypothetical protein
LIVELDGGHHSDRLEQDTRRTVALEALGYRVIRFWNNDVLESIDSVLERIVLELDAPHPNPLPRGARGNEVGRSHAGSLPEDARGIDGDASRANPRPARARG